MTHGVTDIASPLVMRLVPIVAAPCLAALGFQFAFARARR
jgi:hypothetical protein